MTDLEKGDILSNWNRVMPQYQPRVSQAETFEWIKNLSPDIKYILLEMPVGGGKSPVGLTASGFMSNNPLGSSFILTPQKILQRQYENDFDQHLLHSMYGKSNYRCESKGASCELGSSIKPKCESCPYKTALAKSVRTPNLVLNYTLALLYFTYMGDMFEPRDLLIMDECHNLEQQLVNLSTFSISKPYCDTLGVVFSKPQDMNEAYKWIGETYWPKLELYLIDQGNEVQRIENSTAQRITADDQAIMKNFIKFKRHADTINDILLCNQDNVAQEYVLIDEYNKFTVKELYAKRAFHNTIKPMADRFLFMSSTILNRDGFCRDLGIDPSEAAFLSLDSEFDVERRRVIYQPAAKMSYGWDSDDPKRTAGRGRMSRGIKNILELHKDVSGIIHTGSFKLSKWVIDELQTHSSHLILHHNPAKDTYVKRDDVIAEYMQHATHQPTILVSPSITEGLDLKHDLGRFAIFAKVPYGNLGDAWVKRRMEISSQWYQRQTLKEMIQGSGRICRDHSDWGFTYILDESFGYLYNKTRHTMIPNWWEEAFEIM
jgi:ATP-dependent DNA helicase DinG